MSLQTRIAALISAIGADIKSLATGKQDKLVSGTSLKTVNGNSLLGAGNLTVSGGASEASAKAWVVFNGTGTVSISSSFNVSSVTDNGTGTYTVNFSSPMNVSDYGVWGQVDPSTSFAGNNANNLNIGTRTTNSVVVSTASSTGSLADYAYVAVLVFTT